MPPPRIFAVGRSRRRDIATLAAMRYEIDGHHFTVFDTGGRGDAVYLLLHGVGLSHRPYERLATRLAAHGRVVVPDLPGFGSTPKPSRGLSVEACARLIAGLLDRLEVASCVAIGHSMGAQFALELALARPDRVSHVVMIGPVVDSRRRTALAQSLALARDSVLEPLATNFIVFTDYLRCGPRWYLKEVAAMLAYPTEEKVVGLVRPLLVIRGANDPIANASWCARLIDAAGGGLNVSIPGERHVVAHTAADRVALEIAAFTAPDAPATSSRASATDAHAAVPAAQVESM